MPNPHFLDFPDRLLLRMLLLSLSLHLAVLMIVQPARVREMVVSPPITARLVEAETITVLPQQVVPASTLPLPPDPNVAPPNAVPAPESPPLPAETPRVPEVVKSAPPTQVVDAKPASLAEVATPLPATDPRPIELPSIPMLFDPTWYTARQLDAQPRALHSIQPTYPAEAQRAGIEGSLKLMLRVDESGAVQEAVVEESDPSGVFDVAALDAFRSARFAPAQKNQRPVRAQIYIRVVFRLE